MTQTKPPEAMTRSGALPTGTTCIGLSVLGSIRTTLFGSTLGSGTRSFTVPTPTAPLEPQAGGQQGEDCDWESEALHDRPFRSDWISPSSSAAPATG